MAPVFQARISERGSVNAMRDEVKNSQVLSVVKLTAAEISVSHEPGLTILTLKCLATSTRLVRALAFI